jgi:hypothetical protein
MSRPTVLLEEAQWRRAVTVGVRRQVMNVLEGVADLHGAGSEAGGFDFHVIGAVGEFATALYLGTDWEGYVGTDRRARVDIQWRGLEIEVRTRAKLWMELPVRDAAKDPDDRILVLAVIGSSPLLVRLVGWCTAEQARGRAVRRVLKEDRGPALYVAQDELRPMEALRELGARREVSLA